MTIFTFYVTFTFQFRFLRMASSRKIALESKWKERKDIMHRGKSVSKTPKNVFFFTCNLLRHDQHWSLLLRTVLNMAFLVVGPFTRKIHFGSPPLLTAFNHEASHHGSHGGFPLKVCVLSRTVPKFWKRSVWPMPDGTTLPILLRR